MTTLANALAPAMRFRPEGMSASEWQARLELAAFYRLAYDLGWSQTIYNHISLALPDEEGAFLINPYGLLYSEVTASNLVKIDWNGKKLAESEYPVNPAGFIIHSAIHKARPDAACIIHTHSVAGMAVACKADGLRYDNFNSAGFYGRIGYHDFQGITTDEEEKDSLVESLGPTNDVLILRNHGLLTVGPNVPETFETMWLLERACEIQLVTYSHAGPPQEIPQEVLEGYPRRRAMMNRTNDRRGGLFFAALARKSFGSFDAIV
ncbi:MAG: class II aldolase/adducin family protein [Microbacterium sp.]